MVNGGIFVDTPEVQRMGAIRKNRHHHAQMVIGAEMSIYIPAFQIAIEQGQPPGFVIGGDNHERFPVLVGKLQGFTDGLIKIQHFLNHIPDIIRVAAVIDLQHRLLVIIV